MDKLAEQGNTATSRQIRSDNISMNLWSMSVPAYWCDVVIGRCMAENYQTKTNSRGEESLINSASRHLKEKSATKKYD